MPALFTTANDTDARFVDAKGDPRHAGFVLTREWPKIDPVSADTLMTAMNAVTSYASPGADKQEYTGPFVHSSLTPTGNQEQEITIRQTLTKVTTIASDTTLFALTPRKTITREVDHGFDAVSTYAKAVNARAIDEQTFTYDYLNPASESTINAINDTKFNAKLAPAATWGFVRKKLGEQKDGTYSLDVVFRLHAEDVGVVEYIATADSNSIIHEERLYDQDTGTPIAITGDTGSNRAVVSSVIRKPDGTFDKVHRVERFRTHGTDTYISAISATATETYALIRNDTNSPADAALTKIRGQRVRVRSRNLDHGAWDKETTVETADTQVTYARAGAAGYSDSVRVFINDTAANPPTTRATDTGVTHTVDVSISREDGTRSYSERTRTKTAIGPKVIVRREMGYTDSISAYINQAFLQYADTLDFGAAARGITYDATPSVDQDGVVGYHKRMRRAVKIAPVPFNYGSYGYQDSVALALNDTGIPSRARRAVADSGYTYDLDGTLHTDGTVNWRQRTRANDSMFVETSYTTRYGTATVKRATNAHEKYLTVDAAALTDSTANTVSPSRNDNRRVDYTIVKSPYGRQGGGSRSWDSEVHGSYVVMVNGDPHTRTKKVKYFPAVSGAGASAFANSGNAPGCGKWPSGIMWKAIKVRDTW